MMSPRTIAIATLLVLLAWECAVCGVGAASKTKTRSVDKSQTFSSSAALTESVSQTAQETRTYSANTRTRTLVSRTKTVPTRTVSPAESASRSLTAQRTDTAATGTAARTESESETDTASGTPDRSMTIPRNWSKGSLSLTGSVASSDTVSATRTAAETGSASARTGTDTESRTASRVATATETLTASDTFSPSDAQTATATDTAPLTRSGTSTATDSLSITSVRTSTTAMATDSGSGDRTVTATVTVGRTDSPTRTHELSDSLTIQRFPPYSSAMEQANVFVASATVAVGIVSAVVGGSSPITVLAAQRVQMLATWRRCRYPDPEGSLAVIESPTRLNIIAATAGGNWVDGYDAGAAAGNTGIVAGVALLLYAVARWKTVSKDFNTAEAFNNIYGPPLLAVAALILWQPTVTAALAALLYGHFIHQIVGGAVLLVQLLAWAYVFHVALLRRDFRPRFLWKRVQPEHPQVLTGGLLRKGDWDPYYWHCVGKPMPPPRRVGPQNPCEVIGEMIMYRSGEWRADDKVLRGVHKPEYIAHLPSVNRGGASLASIMAAAGDDNLPGRLLATTTTAASVNSSPSAAAAASAPHVAIACPPTTPSPSPPRTHSCMLTRQEYFYWRNSHDAFLFFVTDRASWFIVVEWGISLAWAVLGAVGRHNRCVLASGLLLVPQAAYIVLLLWKRPFGVGFDNVSVTAVAVLQSACIVLLTLAMNSQAYDAFPVFNPNAKYMKLNESMLLAVTALILLRALSDVFRVLRSLRRDAKLHEAQETERRNALRAELLARAAATAKSLGDARSSATERLLEYSPRDDDVRCGYEAPQLEHYGVLVELDEIVAMERHLAQHGDGILNQSAEGATAAVGGRGGSGVGRGEGSATARGDPATALLLADGADDEADADELDIDEVDDDDDDENGDDHDSDDDRSSDVGFEIGDDGVLHEVRVPRAAKTRNSKAAASASDGHSRSASSRRLVPGNPDDELDVDPRDLDGMRQRLTRLYELDRERAVRCSEDRKKAKLAQQQQPDSPVAPAARGAKSRGAAAKAAGDAAAANRRQNADLQAPRLSRRTRPHDINDVASVSAFLWVNDDEVPVSMPEAPEAPELPPPPPPLPPAVAAALAAAMATGDGDGATAAAPVAPAASKAPPAKRPPAKKQEDPSTVAAAVAVAAASPAAPSPAASTEAGAANVDPADSTAAASVSPAPPAAAAPPKKMPPGKKAPPSSKQPHAPPGSPSASAISPAATSSAGNALVDDCLNAHNALRRRHAVPALAWHADCERRAAECAAKCSADGKMAHSFNEGELGSHGQNVFYASDAASVAAAVQKWYSELRDHAYDFAVGGETQPGTGHFTQVVWAASTHVGAAVSPCGKFVVANYYPAGNVAGQWLANVRPVSAVPAPLKSPPRARPVAPPPPAPAESAITTTELEDI